MVPKTIKDIEHKLEERSAYCLVYNNSIHQVVHLNNQRIDPHDCEVAVYGSPDHELEHFTKVELHLGVLVDRLSHCSC